MGRYAEALTLEQPPEPKSKRHELLVGLRAEPDIDGDAATVSIQFTNQNPFRVYVPLIQAAAVISEIRSAASKMIQRQGWKLDRGASKILELCEAARRPATIEIIVEPATHDRLFLFQFENDPPMSVRVSAEELPIMLAKLARAIARSAH